MCDTEVIKEDSMEEKNSQTIMEIATEPVREDSEEEKRSQTTMKVTNEPVREDSEEEKHGQTIMEVANEPVREDSEEEKHGQTIMEVENEPVREDSEEEKQIKSEKNDDSVRAEDSAVEHDVQVSGEVLLEEVIGTKTREKNDQEQETTLEKLKLNVVLDEKSDSDSSPSPIQDKYIPQWMKPVSQCTVYQNDDKQREIHRKNLQEADDKQQQDVYVPPAQLPSTGTVYQNYPIPPPVPPRSPKKKPPANLPDSPPPIPVRSVLVPKSSQQIPEEKPPPVPDKSYRTSRFSREFQATGNTTPEDEGKMSKVTKSTPESDEAIFEVSGTLPQRDKIVTETSTRSEKCNTEGDGIKEELLATHNKSVKNLTQMFENKTFSDLPAKDNLRDIVKNTSGDTIESWRHVREESNNSDSDEFHSMEEDNYKFDMQLEKYQQNHPPKEKNLQFEQMSSIKSISENYSLENASDVIRSLQTVIYEENKDIDEKPPPLPSQPPPSPSQPPPLPSQPPTCDESYIASSLSEDKIQTAPADLSVTEEMLTQEEEDLQNKQDEHTDDSQIKGDGQVNPLLIEQGKDTKLSTNKQDEETKPLQGVDTGPVPYQYGGTRLDFDQQHTGLPFQQDENPQAVPVYQQTETATNYDKTYSRFQETQSLPFPHTENKETDHVVQQTPDYFAHQQDLPHNQGYNVQQHPSQNLHPQSSHPPDYRQSYDFFQYYGPNVYYPPQQFQVPFDPNPQPHWRAPFSYLHEQTLAAEVKHSEHSQWDKNTNQTSAKKPSPVTKKSKKKAKRNSSGDSKEKKYSSEKGARKPENKQDPPQHREKKEEEHFPKKLSVCIRGLEPTCNCENVCLYLESMAKHAYKQFNGEVDSSDVVYGEDKTIAVFTLSETLDFHEMKKKCCEKPFRSASLEICEAGPVRGIVVSSDQEMPSKSALKQYFQNTAASGGGNITTILSTEDGCRKICFKDTATVDNVCQKHVHNVEGVHLSVTKLFECEFGEVWDQQKHKVCLPQDLKTDDINPEKKIFITKSMKVLSLLNDKLNPLFAKVKVTEDLYIECTLQQTTQNVRQLAKRWEGEVKKIWLEFVEESTQKAEMFVEEEVWPQLLPHINEVKENDMLHVNITKKGNVTKLTFVGHKDVFETVTTTVTKQKEEIVAKVERKKKITEDRMQISTLEVRLLARTETLSEANKIAEDLKVTADEEKGVINFRGVHEDIEKAKVKIYETIHSFGKLKLKSGSDDIYREQIDLLEKNKDILEKFVENKFCAQNLKVELTFDKEGDDFVINARYLQGSDISKIKRILIEATKWESKYFKTSESKEVLSTHRWKKEMRNVEQKYGKEVVITSDPDKSQVTVTSTPDIHTEIVNRLVDFVHTNAVYCEKFTVNDKGKMKFIKQHCDDVMRTLEKKFKEFYADIEVEDENIVLQGTKQGLKQLKHEIRKIVDGILSTKHTITKLGIDSVIGPGKEEFASVERHTRSVVTFVDTRGQSSNVTTANYGESDSDEDEYTTTEVGETWRRTDSRLADRVEEKEPIYENVMPHMSAVPKKTKVKCKNGTVIRLVKGELGKQKADVLVCTTTKELDLSKGKCAANLLNIEGTELQVQCRSSYPDGVSYGDVAVIDSVKLDCKKVYLGSLPNWNADNPKKRSIKVFIKNCLEKANSSGFQSIYFASLGTGRLNYPLPDTASLMYEAVKEYNEKQSSCSVRDVGFVLYKKDVAVISAFENEEYSQLHPSTRVSSPRKLQGPFDTKKGIKVTFVEGPIDQQKADVIVCAVSKDLNIAVGGVGKALVTAGGDSLVTESKTNFPKGINFGDVIEVNGGKLKCKKVYLSSLPDYNSEEEKAKTKIKEKTLYKVVYQFLEKAVKAGMKSIALPAMGTKQIKWPASYVATLMYDCVVEFASSHPNCCLTDVRFVVISSDKTTVQAFRDEEQQRLSPPQQYSSGLKSFYTKKGKVQVSIETGSISKFTKADIIVCSVSDNLDLTRGKVGEALIQEGGTTLQQECNKKYPSGIKVGDVAKIGPGKLQCKGVYLLTFPRYATGKEKECDKLLLDSIKKVLETASANGMTSVAFPALGTGYNKFPEDRVATLSYEAVMMYDKSLQASPIKSVSFVLLSSHATAIKAFQREELKRKGVPPTLPSQEITRGAAAYQSVGSRMMNRLQGATVGIGAKFKRTFTVTGDNRPNTKDTPKARPSIVIAQSTKSSKPNEFMFGSISLTIGQGNIAEMKKPVDAIVNSTNESLDLTMGGVTKAILDKCDSKQLNDECKSKMAEMKKTGVTYTSACGLKNCQTIIHVTAQDTLKDWQKMMVKCLELADNLKFSTMAFPALGTGSGFTVFKCEEIVETLHNSLIEFTTKRPNQSLRVIRLIIFDQNMVWPMTEAMMKCCENSSTPSYKQKMGDILSGLGLAPRRGLASRLSISSSVTLWILSDTDQDIQEAIDEITKIVDSKYITHENTDPLIESLEKEEITKIENLKNKFAVEISVDQAKVLITIQGTKEEVDFAIAQVFNLLSAFQFRRHEENEAEHIATKVQWYYKEMNSKGLLELTPYPKVISMKLENTLKGNYPYLDFLDNGIDCRVDIATMKEFEISDPSNTTIDVIRREKQADGKHKLPDEWTEMSDPKEIVKVVPLLSSSPEYTNLATKFTNSVTTGKFKNRFNATKLKVLGIERIQNPSLYRQYACKRELMEKNNPPGTKNEQLLWHGTKQDVMVSINYHGFNRSYAGKKNGAWFGDGVYFANDASYSARDWVAGKDGKGKQGIYLAMVLTGQYCKGVEDMKYLPPLQNNSLQNYDSAVEDLNNPLEFIIFNDTQAYPEYCIYFQTS